MVAALRLVHRIRRHLRRERIFRDRLNPLDRYNDDELFRRFRFPRRELLQLIDTFAEDLNYPCASMQILVALRFYVTGSFQEVIGDTFGVSKATICNIIHRVSRTLAAAINNMQHYSPSV